MGKFKISDQVKILKNESDSINHVGDIGTIVDIDQKPNGQSSYKVYVKGRTYDGVENISNWSEESEIELI